jgi:hypothetical protein
LKGPALAPTSHAGQKISEIPSSSAHAARIRALRLESSDKPTARGNKRLDALIVRREIGSLESFGVEDLHQ